MGLLSGGLNGRRFRTTTTLPDGFRDLWLNAVRERAMVTDIDASDDEPRMGWATISDFTKGTFELNDLLFDRFLCLSLRTDKKRVNGKFLQVALSERVAALEEERGQSVKRDEKEMIKDVLTKELTRRSIPSVSSADIAWDIHTGEVLFFATSDATIENLKVMFEDTFEQDLFPERQVDWLTDQLSRDEVIERASTYLAEARGGAGTRDPIDGWYPDDPLEGATEGLAADFITWLWLQSEQTDGQFRIIDERTAQATRERLEDVDPMFDDITENLKHADLTIWLEGKLKLVDFNTEERPETVTITGEAPTTSAAARSDMLGGKRPVEATIGWKMDDLECRMTIRSTELGLAISGLKIPFEVKNGTEEKVFERMMLLDLVHTTTKQLYRQFFLARTSPEWIHRLDSWQSTELAAK